MDEGHIGKGEQEESEAAEDAVDLNQVFRESKLDLNAMFPDGEMRDFLRQVERNRRRNERFLAGFEREKFRVRDE